MRSGKFRDNKLLHVIEDERRRLGNELHDSLGQQVTGIAFLAKALEQKIASASYDESAMIAARLVVKANRLTEQAGYLSQRLQEPEAIRAVDFPETLRNWTRDLHEVFGVRCVYALNSLDLTGREMATALFRLTREMVHETLAHCPQAPEINVKIQQTRDQVRLTVNCKRGVAKNKKGISVLLRVRADLLGATLRSGSEKSGWALRAALPVKARKVGQPNGPNQGVRKSRNTVSN